MPVGAGLRFQRTHHDFAETNRPDAHHFAAHDFFIVLHGAPESSK